jgi:hypothetical protein
VIWLVCAVFYPLSYPIATILDSVLGEEIGLSYSREELIALLAMHSVGGRTKQGPQGDIHDTGAFRAHLFRPAARACSGP